MNKVYIGHLKLAKIRQIHFNVNVGFYLHVTAGDGGIDNSLLTLVVLFTNRVILSFQISNIWTHDYNSEAKVNVFFPTQLITV